MLVSLKGLAIGGSLPVSVEERMLVPASYGLSDCDVLASFAGHVANGGNVVDVEGVLSAELSLPCSRCLKETIVCLHVPVLEHFKKLAGPDGGADAFFNVDDETVDLTPIIHTNLLLNIPIKALCMDACKGLCPICGFNLNEGACACDRTHTDPRFEALRSLFQDKEV